VCDLTYKVPSAFGSEDGNTTTFRNVAFCSEYYKMGKSRNPIILREKVFDKIVQKMLHVG
jgi:hypothetical protein